MIRRAPLGRLLIVTALGGLLPLGASYWWPLELLSHFRVQYIVLAAPLTLLALACRQRLAGFLLAAATAANVWPLIPYLPDTGQGESNADLFVLNINVNSANEAHGDVIAAIRAANPDLVSILELSNGLDNALVALEDEYPHRYTLPAVGNFGIGVLSRFPLSNSSAIALLETVAIDSTVELPNGPLRFLAVHLVPPIGAVLARERNMQLDQLAEFAAAVSEPLLVCGDFNLSPYSPFFGRFRTAANLSDTRLGRGLDISWPTFMPLFGIPIDHCLTRGPFAVESVARLERMGSDHYPVQLALKWLDD